MPAELRAVVELFATALAKVAFPDVDQAVLRRHADEVRAGAREVEAPVPPSTRPRRRWPTGPPRWPRSPRAASPTRRIYADAHPERTELAAALAPLVGAVDGEPREAPAVRRGRRRAPRPELPLADADPAEPGGAAATPAKRRLAVTARAPGPASCRSSA